MAEELFVLDAQERSVVGKKVKQLRTQGIVPITVYGPKFTPINLQVPYRPLEIALMKAGGTTLIDIAAGGKKHTVLAREVQRHVLKGTIQHVDFFVVDQSATLRTEVPVHLVGESPAVEARKGILLVGANTISIETLPSKLLHFIEVDLSSLVNVGDAITVSDLDLGPDVTVLSEPEEMIARITQTSAARAEEDLAEEDGGPTSAEPEVITKGKAEDEDED